MTTQESGEESLQIQDVLIADDKDWYLQSIIDTVINAGVDIGVTLTIGGAVISGVLISGKKYFELLGQSIAAPSRPTDDIQNVLANAWSGYAVIYEKPEGVSEDWRPDPASYIHLKDAKFYAPGQRPIPETGMLWRGKLASVDGFSMANFGPPS